MKCKCCTLELEVIDEVKLCHYCYMRDCSLKPGKCDNAILLQMEKYK